MDKPYEDPVNTATSLIMDKNDEKTAELILKKVVANIPDNWKPINELTNEIRIAFWHKQEFLAYIEYYKKTRKAKNLIWVVPSYSRAFYYLSFIAVRRKEWNRALVYINKALELEEDHPVLLCEKAQIMNVGMNEKEEAYKIFMKAIAVRPWWISAQAMRGAAVVLIDLKKLKEAEMWLQESLKIEPENKVAINEMKYIKQLRSGKAPISQYELIQTLPK